MDTPTERDSLITYLPTPNFTGSMRLHKVGFTYPVPGMMVAPRILENININIEAGEQIAILGRIGSGKSTLLRVMARLYQQSSGQIFIDEVDATRLIRRTGVRP